MTGLTADRLRQVLSYDAGSGQFTWTDQAKQTRRRGEVPAGHVNRIGYVQINIDRRHYLGHRLAWLYTHSRWPEDLLDHINGIRSDNRLSNLRPASKAENGQNMRSARSDNKCGLLGVSFDSKKKAWRAQIAAGGRNRHIGYFPTPEDAHSAYVSAKRLLHPYGTL